MVSRLVGFVRTAALAWMIPQAEFGLFGVALLIVNVLLPVCTGGLYEGVMRHVPFHESSGTLRRFLIKTSAWLLGILAGATTILFFAAEPCGSFFFSEAASPATVDRGISAVSGSPSGLLRASLVCVVGLGVYQTLLGWFKGLRMFRALAAAEVVSSVLFAGLALGAAYQGFTSARAMIFAYAGACAVTVVVFAPGLITRLGAGRAESNQGPDRIEPDQSTELRSPGVRSYRLVSYSAWAAGTALAWHAMSYYPMWYLLKVSNGTTVGAFHAVRTITQLTQVGAAMLTAVVAAHVTRVWEHRGRDAAMPRLDLLTKAVLILLLIGATVLSMLRPLIMRLFPASFASGAVAYDALLMFFLLVGVVGLVAVRLNLVEKPRLVLAAWLVGAVVNVFFTHGMVRAASHAAGEIQAGALSSAAWASVSGMLAATIVCIVAARREGLALKFPALALMAAMLSVALGWVIALPVAVVLIFVSMKTQIVFSEDDRAQMRRFF